MEVAGQHRQEVAGADTGRQEQEGGEPGMTGTGRRDGGRKIRRLEATDERQYMLNEHYEVYEKQGAPVGAMSFHYHDFYEIIYVLEGEYSSLLGNRTYHMKKGDFLLIDQNEMHKYHYMEKKHDSSRRIILWVTQKQLAELGGKDMDLTACFRKEKSCAFHFPIYYEELLQGYLLKLAMTDMAESAVPGVKQVLDRGILTLFFVYLNVLCGREEYLSDSRELITHPLVEQVCVYIEDHLAERITVELLAEQVHMSKYYFLRKFKELTGDTVHSFLTHKRLIRACQKIKEGNSITQVWQSCGFADYSSFLRNFRAVYGMTPGRYRELMLDTL